MAVDSEALIIISAPSGAGKNTILNGLLSKRTDLQFSISTTTRKPRFDEVHGKNYYFCTCKKFKRKIQYGDFLEYTQALGHYYGTTEKEILRIQKIGCIPILDINIQGFQQVQNKNKNILSFFIMPPSLVELKQRLILRGTENEEEISNRLKLAKDEIKYKNKYHHIIINDNLSTAINKLDSLIKPL